MMMKADRLSSKNRIFSQSIKTTTSLLNRSHLYLANTPVRIEALNKNNR